MKNDSITLLDTTRISLKLMSVNYPLILMIFSIKKYGKKSGKA